MASTIATQSSVCENGDSTEACTFCSFGFDSSEPTLRVDGSLFGDGNPEKSQWPWHSNSPNPMVLPPGTVVLIESPSDDSDNGKTRDLRMVCSKVSISVLIMPVQHRERYHDGNPYLTTQPWKIFYQRRFRII